MHRRYSNLVLLFLVLVGAGLACSDDPVQPEAFAVTVRVVDGEGAPVAGLLMNVASDNPYLQDANRAKGATVIPFQTPVEARAELYLEDVAGLALRNLATVAIPAGAHQWVWDGRDDAGTLLHSGRYRARLVLRTLDGEEVVYEETTDMLMVHLDPLRAPVGQTDDSGRVVLTDKRLFPHLFGLPPMTAQNETGAVMGTLVPTSAMIFTLADTANGGLMTFREEVQGPTILEFVWNGKPRDRLVREDAGPGGDVGPVEEFSLGPVYPNPFN